MRTSSKRGRRVYKIDERDVAPYLDIANFPERGVEPEVKFILTLGEYRIPLEVKSRQHIDSHRDTIGLRAFIEKRVSNAPFAILVTMYDDVPIPDPRIIPASFPPLLLLRKAAGTTSFTSLLLPLSLPADFQRMQKSEDPTSPKSFQPPIAAFHLKPLLKFLKFCKRSLWNREKGAKQVIHRKQGG